MKKSYLNIFLFFFVVPFSFGAAIGLASHTKVMLGDCAIISFLYFLAIISIYGHDSISQIANYITSNSFIAITCSRDLPLLKKTMLIVPIVCINTIIVRWWAKRYRGEREN